MEQEIAKISHIITGWAAGTMFWADVAVIVLCSLSQVRWGFAAFCAAFGVYNLGCMFLSMQVDPVFLLQMGWVALKVAALLLPFAAIAAWIGGRFVRFVLDHEPKR